MEWKKLCKWFWVSVEITTSAWDWQYFDDLCLTSFLLALRNTYSSDASPKSNIVFTYALWTLQCHGEDRLTRTRYYRTRAYSRRTSESDTWDRKRVRLRVYWRWSQKHGKSGTHRSKYGTRLCQRETIRNCFSSRLHTTVYSSTPLILSWLVFWNYRTSHSSADLSCVSDATQTARLKSYSVLWHALTLNVLDRIYVFSRGRGQREYHRFALDLRVELKKLQDLIFAIIDSESSVFCEFCDVTWRRHFKKFCTGLYVFILK